MKVVINSYEILGAIGRHSQAFSAIDELVKKQAIALLTAQLKHKSLDLAAYRTVATAIGRESFELLDTVDDKLLTAIAKKVDPHAAVTKTADGDALRPHLIGLAVGRIAPAAKAEKTAGGGKKSASKLAKGSQAVAEGPHAIATKPPGRR